MANRIKLSCEFSFRGKRFTPTLELNLDEIMAQHRALPDLYPLLAERNNIGLYSYEYEMLEAETLSIQALEGWVADHINEQQFDEIGFEHQWHIRNAEAQLQAIIEKHGLSSNIEILAALTEAYQLGR